MNIKYSHGDCGDYIEVEFKKADHDDLQFLFRVEYSIEFFE